MISYTLEKLVPILLGFGLAQFFNFVKWIFRPKLSIDYVSAYGLSFYTDTSGSQDVHRNTFGFHLRNKWGRTAKNVRVFIEKIESGEKNGPLAPVLSSLSEVSGIPSDVLPKGAHVEIALGEWTSESISVVPNINMFDDFYIERTFGHEVYWFHVLATESEGGSFRGKLRFQTHA